MNTTAYMTHLDSADWMTNLDPAAPRALQVGVQLATAAYFAYPLVSDRVAIAVGGVFSGLSYLYRITEASYERHVPQGVKKGVALAGMTVYKGVVCFEEVLDFANFGGTKDPQASISKSLERLALHDQPFSDFCDFLSDQASDYFLKNEEEIKEKISLAVKEKSFDFAGDIARWFLGLSKNLIAQTIKANLLHIAANLADQGFDPQHPFRDQQRNPMGRLISVIGVCLSDFEIRLEGIERSPAEEQAALFDQLFQDVSTALLAKFFPRGAEDIQLFHHTIPVKLFKEFVWKALNQQLPALLEKIYLETRPLSKQHPNWQHHFDHEAQGLNAAQMLKFPSSFYQHVMRAQIGPLVDSQIPAINSWLKARGVEGSDHLSGLLAQYAREFLLTQDESLAKIGSFVENYLMERILFNLSNFTPRHADAPMPIYILQKWIKGNCFKMVSSCLSGEKKIARKVMSGALQDLLTPFGLDRKETFPLPSFLLEQAWPSILKFQQEKLPTLLLKGIPKWTVLSNSRSNQQHAAACLDDPMLIASGRKNTRLLLDQGVDRFKKLGLSPFATLNELLPTHPLSAVQQENLDDQVDELLEDDESLLILLNFGQECLEGFAFQVCNDLYEHYTESTAQDSLADLFEEPSNPIEDVQGDSFPVWLSKEVSKALKCLSPKEFSEQEAEAFRRAIELQHALRPAANDRVRQMKIQADFNDAWGLLEPKFEQASKNLLRILGYSNPESLPLPKPLQKVVWTRIHAVLPMKIFEEAGALMQPLIDKKSLRKEVESLPHGDRLAKGCMLFAQDVVDNMPEWVENKLVKLHDMRKEKLPGFDISPQTEEAFLHHLRSFIFQEDSAYDAVWFTVEDFIEGMMLKLVLRLNKISQKDLHRIQLFLLDAREQWIVLEKSDGVAFKEKELEIAAKLVDQVMDILEIYRDEDLYGVPARFRKQLMSEIKEKLAQGILGAYQLDSKIRCHTIDEDAASKHVPISNVSETVLILTRYVLDKATDHLSAREENGELEILPKLVPDLNHWLERQSQKGYQLAGYLQEIIEEGIPFPYLEALFDLLDHHQNKPYKEQIVDWINPFLTNHVIGAMLPLLEREKKESPDFDEALLLALLPILTRHLKHLKCAALREGGVNFVNVREAAGHDLHPDLQVLQESDDENEKSHESFYQRQTALIFKAIFQNGIEDFISLLPEGQLEPEQIDLLWEMAQTAISSNLPTAFDALFDKDFLIEFLNDLFEEIVEEFDQLGVKGSENEVQANPLFKDDRNEIHKLDRALGEFILESAQFVELPMLGMQKLPSWLKKWVGSQAIEWRMTEKIGALVRKRIDGELLPKAMRRVLRRLSKRKHIKMTKAERIEAKKQASIDLKNWERKLIEKCAENLIPLIGVKIKQAGDSFKNPLVKTIINAYLTLCIFVIRRILGPLIRLVKADKVIVSYLFGIFDNAISKSVRIFSDPTLHKDLVFSGVEAFEKVLLRPSVGG